MFLTKSKEIDDYIYSEEFNNLPLKNVTDRIQEVNMLLQPFMFRKKEYSHREGLYNMTFERFTNHTSILDTIKKRKSWVDEDRFKEVYAVIY